MKSTRTLFILLASLAFVFTSCKEEKDSTLNLNTIKGRATVEGKVTYNVGDRKDINGNVENNQQAALGGKTLYFYLQLSSLGSYSGTVKPYTVETAADGTFEIDLPANNDGIMYQVSVESFKNSRFEYDPVNDNFISKNYFFTNENVKTFNLRENLGQYISIELNNYELIN